MLQKFFKILMAGEQVENIITELHKIYVTACLHINFYSSEYKLITLIDLELNIWKGKMNKLKK